MREDDGLQAFLRQAADHTLLTAAEEKALGRQVQKAEPDPIRHSCTWCPSCRARHKLVQSTIRLVVSIGRYYRNRGLPFDDVIQYGIIGCDRAARKFDPERGIRFSTYATLWIKQAIQRGITKSGSTIRLPSEVASRRARARDVILKGGEPAYEALAERLDLSVPEVERALQAAEVVTSLDRETRQSDDLVTMTLLDTLADPHADNPADLEPTDTRWLEEALGELSLDQRLVLEMHFGISDGEPCAIPEIAKRLGKNPATGKQWTVSGVQGLKRDGLATLREQVDSIAEL